MNNSIIVTVFLQGQIGGAVKSVDEQVHTVLLNHGTTLTKKIKHTDRRSTECSKQFSINGEIVSQWVNGDCPYWENIRDWKKMSKKRRLVSYVRGFDEGFGVTFEVVEDGE